MAGLLSKIAGGVNRFSDELLAPTNPLGKLGMYLGAASGGVLGQASLAHQQDQLSRGDADLDRQYKQAQIAKLAQGPNNDSEADWSFYQSRLTPDQFEQYKANRIYSPPHLTTLPDGRMVMIGGWVPPTPTAQQPPATLPPDFDFGDGK